MIQNYRGYEISKGACGGIGIFSDGYQTGTVETEEAAIAMIDGWHADWRALIAKNPTDGLAESCRKAIRDCGEEV